MTQILFHICTQNELKNKAVKIPKQLKNHATCCLHVSGFTLLAQTNVRKYYTQTNIFFAKHTTYKCEISKKKDKTIKKKKNSFQMSNSKPSSIHCNQIPEHASVRFEEAGWYIQRLIAFVFYVFVFLFY